MLGNSGKLLKTAGRKIRMGMILRSIVRKYILSMVVGTGSDAHPLIGLRMSGVYFAIFSRPPCSW
jgi:aromatic ring-opening dioxygenase catalytic subunit (LigB family)